MVKTKRISIIIFVITAIVYLLTSAGHTAFNHYTLLAGAFLKGHLYITKDAPWLEKAPIDGMHFYVVDPPMPAILAVPFVLFFGENFPQDYIAILVGAMIGVLTFLLALKLKRQLSYGIYFWALVSFSTIIWFLSSVGSIWYFSQITAFLFILAALNESFGKKKPIVIALFLICAFWARNQTIVYVPLFLYLLRNKLKNMALFLLILGGGVFLDGLYNFARFGNFLQSGLTLIPGLVNEPWF